MNYKSNSQYAIEVQTFSFKLRGFIKNLHGFFKKNSLLQNLPFSEVDWTVDCHAASWPREDCSFIICYCMTNEAHTSRTDQS